MAGVSEDGIRVVIVNPLGGVSGFETVEEIEGMPGTPDCGCDEGRLGFGGCSQDLGNFDEGFRDFDKGFCQLLLRLMLGERLGVGGRGGFDGRFHFLVMNDW